MWIQNPPNLSPSNAYLSKNVRSLCSYRAHCKNYPVPLQCSQMMFPDDNPRSREVVQARVIQSRGWVNPSPLPFSTLCASLKLYIGHFTRVILFFYCDAVKTFSLTIPLTTWYFLSQYIKKSEFILSQHPRRFWVAQM